ncbi:MAG: protein translocase subunit SecD, partial [bacterium]|nr:protein translocase subunit SecD [bacterium]
MIFLVLCWSAWMIYPSFTYYKIDEVERLDSKYNDLRKDIIKYGMDLQGGVHLVIELDQAFMDKMVEDLRKEGKSQAEIDYDIERTLDSAAAVVQTRVDEFGVAEVSLVKQPPDRLVLEMPGVSDPKEVQNLVQAGAQLGFHLLPPENMMGQVIGDIDDSLETDFQSLFPPSGRTGMAAVVVEENNYTAVDSIISSTEISHLIPRGYTFKWSPLQQSGDYYHNPHRLLYLVEETPAVTGARLDDARVDYTNNQPMVYLFFDSAGSRIFARVTEQHINEQLAVVLEDRVYVAPRIIDKITTGVATITGIGDIMEARQIAVVLRAGALPAPLTVQESRVVGPSLGQDSINKGILSGLIGGVVVLIFMVVYYSMTGAVADIAVVLNLILLLAGMALFRATLTLPGIAGIVLTIGMAVDANVLIFERLREELHSKRTQGIPLILDKAYGRAFMTIFDANITTLITALILFQFGTGPIKGFAVTLSLGIIVSMFTAVFVSRVIQDVMVAWGMKELRLGKIAFFSKANYDFFRKPFHFMTFTSTLGILGFILLVMGWVSGDLKGIDFAGGAELFAKFENKVDISDVRSNLARVGVSDAVIQEVLDGENRVMIRVREGVVTEAAELETKLKEALPEQKFETLNLNIVQAKVGNELLWKGLYCIFFASFGILLYITARFEFRFALAAVICLFHDLLFVLAVLAVTKTQFNLPTIAALLTVLGYSLNDTIVVFDRIRENYKSSVLNFKEIINLSVNQTLSRTVNTSLTTLFVVFTLFLFGGSVIHAFALTLLIGIVIGTYSSIFVASPLLFLFTQRG